MISKLRTSSRRAVRKVSILLGTVAAGAPYLGVGWGGKQTLPCPPCSPAHLASPPAPHLPHPGQGLLPRLLLLANLVASPPGQSARFSSWPIRSLLLPANPVSGPASCLNWLIVECWFAIVTSGWAQGAVLFPPSLTFFKPPALIMCFTKKKKTL